MTKRAVIEVSLPSDPRWEVGVVDHLVDDFLTLFNHRLADLGIRAERTAATTTGEDVVVLGRIRIVDRDGAPAIDAFECDPV